MNFAKSILYVACFPHNGWSEVKSSDIQSQEVKSRVLYPMMAIVALSAFMSLAYNHEVTLTECIQKAIIEFVKYFFTFLVTSYVLTGFFPTVVKRRQSANKANVLVQYCMVIIMALNIIDNLLPVSFPYLKILYVYIFFAAWKANEYMDISEDSDKIFLVVAAAMILILPMAISYLLGIGFGLNR